MRKRIWTFLFALLCFLVTVFLGLFVLKYWIFYSTRSEIYRDIDTVPRFQTGLLLGARVYESGRLSPLLRDRADAVWGLYKASKVQKILVSGDNGRPDYDEVNAVKNYLLEKGVDGDDLFLDHAGFDTYDSLYRARDIFEVESLIIVTQGFHLPRALFLARHLGLDAVGFVSDRYSYSRGNVIREFFANGKAFFNIVFRSRPRFLGDSIPITGNSFDSWD